MFVSSINEKFSRPSVSFFFLYKDIHRNIQIDVSGKTPSGTIKL